MSTPRKRIPEPFILCDECPGERFTREQAAAVASSTPSKVSRCLQTGYRVKGFMFRSIYDRPATAVLVTRVQPYAYREWRKVRPKRPRIKGIWLPNPKLPRVKKEPKPKLFCSPRRLSKAKLNKERRVYKRPSGWRTAQAALRRKRRLSWNFSLHGEESSLSGRVADRRAISPADATACSDLVDLILSRLPTSVADQLRDAIATNCAEISPDILERARAVALRLKDAA